ncbi:hypothetical protein K466DRAFT_320577 [Polyporus arcularius HHB13444]|uniref:Uncharacterized protein n=1 Tax=Polyporus arcularius HHB13444 TaxID=1314778 RepID=A0A5C3PSW1_9APHY|nr:hypothetical protein K466DRAFT_320577 [Polyporus arcularius HHB13444]
MPRNYACTMSWRTDEMSTLATARRGGGGWGRTSALGISRLGGRTECSALTSFGGRAGCTSLHSGRGGDFAQSMCVYTVVIVLGENQ